MSKSSLEFYSCDYLNVELQKHKSKLLKLTKLTEAELLEVIRSVTYKVKFINEALIPEKQFRFAEKLIGDVDPDDIPFVALTKQLKGKLWTGDKMLSTALLSRGFTAVRTTQQLWKLVERDVTK